MQVRGQITDITSAFSQTVITIRTKHDPAQVEKLKGQDIDITMERHRERRSLRANAFFWSLVGEISRAIHADKWEIYMELLKGYGPYTVVMVQTAAADDFCKLWRETEIIGEADGYTEILCYKGSSHYNSKEMAVLIDGTISEMRQMDMETPAEDEWRAILEDMEKHEQSAKKKAGNPEQGEDPDGEEVGHSEGDGADI